MSQVAAELHVTRSAVHYVVFSRSRSKRIEDAISRHTKLSLAQLWPRWHRNSAPGEAL